MMVIPFRVCGASRRIMSRRRRTCRWPRHCFAVWTHSTSLNLQLDDLTYLAQRFTSRVSALVADDPDLLAYVQTLEQTDDDAPPIEREISFDTSGAHRVPREGGLPTAEQAIEGAEELLRRYRDGNTLD